MTDKMTEEAKKPEIKETDNITAEQANTEEVATDEVSVEETEKSDAEKLTEAEEQIAMLKDQLLRQMAEFDNYRKRTLKEKADLILSGGQKLMEALLPVLDDIERAQQNIAASNEIETLKEGVELILSKLTKTLGAQGLKRMETEGAAFDTDFHEAVALIPATEDAQKGSIIDCVQAGYLLNDKVIRHAKVVVGQ